MFVSDTDSLPSGKLDHYYGGTPLRGFSTSDIGDWQRRVVQLDRRVILVARIECLAWRVVLAAMIYGAHVREELLAPMIRYKLLSRCVVVFSKNFAQAHRQVVQVAREASRMTHQLGLASVAGSRPNQAQAPFLLHEREGSCAPYFENQAQPSPLDAGVLHHLHRGQGPSP